MDFEKLYEEWCFNRNPVESDDDSVFPSFGDFIVLDMNGRNRNPPIVRQKLIGTTESFECCVFAQQKRRKAKGALR